MTVFDGSASLQIYSDMLTASDVSDALKIAPSFAAEKGETRTHRHRGQTATAISQDVHHHAIWTLEVDSNDAAQLAAPDDTAGFASLILLTQRLSGKHEALEELRHRGFQLYISWYGTAGRSQGGYVMPIELIRDLASIRCNLFGNLYSPDDL